MAQLAVCFLLATAPLLAGATTLRLHSPSALVYDLFTDQVLLEKHADDVVPLASLTKVMTAMVVLDQVPALDEALTVTADDVDQLKHSSSRIPIGTSLAREEMLRLALMSSENRLASALSRSTVVGGQAAFVELMNVKAHSLGMERTRFVDPTGLSPQNVSTARDLMKMARAASHYPLITEFTTLSHHRVTVGARTLAYRNTNRLLGQPGWDIWITKTGFIREAGHCIAMEVNTQDGPVIIVLLGAATQRARAADLMAIRRWLTGQPMLQASRAGQRIDEHQVGALSHKGGLRRASANASATRVHGPAVRPPLKSAHAHSRRNGGSYSR